MAGSGHTAHGTASQMAIEMLIERQARDQYWIRVMETHESRLLRSLRQHIERLAEGEMKQALLGILTQLELHDRAENAEKVAARADVRQAAGWLERVFQTAERPCANRAAQSA